MILRPLPISRVSNAVPGLLLAAAAWPFMSDAHRQAWLRWGITCVGLALAIRGFRIGVTCQGDRATVRGFLRSRTINRNQITELTELPSIVWRDEKGKEHSSPVLAVMASGRLLPRYQRHSDECTKRLRRWIKRRR